MPAVPRGPAAALLGGEAVFDFLIDGYPEARPFTLALALGVWL